MPRHSHGRGCEEVDHEDMDIDTYRQDNAQAATDVDRSLNESDENFSQDIGDDDIDEKRKRLHTEQESEDDSEEQQLQYMYKRVSTAMESLK